MKINVDIILIPLNVYFCFRLWLEDESEYNEFNKDWIFLLSLSDFWVVFSIEGTIIWIASGCYKRIKRFSIVFKVGHVKFVSNSGDRIYILLPNHRAHMTREASLTIQTFMIDKWDIHTKEKGHGLRFLYF